MTDARPGGRGELSLSDRVAVVIGGSGGIGAATARRFASAGARVVVGYHQAADRAAALVHDLTGTGHRAVRLPVDDTTALEAGMRKVSQQLGRVDVLVNAAGTTRAIPHADLDALDDATFDRILVTNVRGPFAVIRTFAPLLRQSGDAVVINVSSIAATTGLGSNIAYCASKAALDTMSMSLARVLGPGIRVIGISPAAVATDFVPGRGRAGAEKQAATTVLMTVAEADDVALAIISAVTQFRLTTGSVFVVDGGRHL